MCWDGTCWDGMGWDGMCCHGMHWDEMGWEGFPRQRNNQGSSGTPGQKEGPLYVSHQQR